jgi:hypothetical protein
VILGVFRQEPTEENTPMALSESAFSELRAAIDVGQGQGGPVGEGSAGVVWFAAPGFRLLAVNDNQLEVVIRDRG